MGHLGRILKTDAFSSALINFSLLLFLVCLDSPPLSAQIKHYQRFGVEEGLLTNRLTSIVEGPDGFIWIATDGAGISRFDGIEFEHFNDPEIIGSPYYFSSLRLKSSIWFGGENQILRYAEDQFKKYPAPNFGSIHQIISYSDSLLFCISDRATFFFEINTGAVEEFTLE
ncbi:MAG: hypothetical protein KDC80_18710, partial [Saprospiraceae bacterium]|nr:hypothetical protein [Saprospiraceae bacterium]